MKGHPYAPEIACLSQSAENLMKFEELQQLLIEAGIENNQTPLEQPKVEAAKADIAKFLAEISGQYNSGNFYTLHFRNFIKKGPKFSTLARIVGDKTYDKEKIDGIYHVTNNKTITGDLAMIVVNQDYIRTQQSPLDLTSLSPVELKEYQRRAFKKIQIPDNSQVLFHDSFFEELSKDHDIEERDIAKQIIKFPPRELPDKKTIEEQRKAFSERLAKLTIPQRPEPIYNMDDFFNNKRIGLPGNISHSSEGCDSGGCDSGGCNSGGCPSGGCSSGGCSTKKRR